MENVQCKCSRAIVTLLLLLSIASCERERVVEIGCPAPPDDRILVAVRAKHGVALGSAEFAPNKSELGALLEATTSGSVQTVLVPNGVRSAKVREMPVEVSALITKLGTRTDADVIRRAARQGIQLSEWIQDRTMMNVGNSLMRALEDPEKVLNDDQRTVELIHKAGTEHKFVIVSAVVYGSGLGLFFDPGPQNPIGANAFRMDGMNVHVGFACERLTRLKTLSFEEQGKMFPMFLQYSEVKYDEQTIGHLKVIKEGNKPQK